MSVYKKQLQKKEDKIKELEEEINTIESDYSEFVGNLQMVDRTSRNVLALIAKGDFEKLEKEYNVEFDLVDEGILFKTPENNSALPFKLAGKPVHIGSYSKSDDGIDIAYYISDSDLDKYTLIVFHFNYDLDFKYILVGAE